MNCLFSDVATCSGESSEHLIQNGLGGRHQRKDIICSCCNSYFCKLDSGLCDFYSLLIDTLRGFMPSSHKKKQRRKKSFLGDVPLNVRSGGIVELGDIYIEYHPDGTFRAMNAPLGTNPEKLRAVAAKHGIVNPKFSLAPLTEIGSLPLIGHWFRFSVDEHRAAAKAILDVIDWQSRTRSVISHARCPQLRRTRDYVRNGAYSEYIDRSAHPMFPLEEEFSNIFGDNEAVFSNRVLFCNDVQANRCIGFLQVAQTMPIGLCLGEAVENRNFSYCYEASLISGGNPRAEMRDEVVISYRKFRDASFFIPRKNRQYSNEFSYAKMMESFDRQCGRAMIFVDRNDDKNIAHWIWQYATDAIGCRHDSGQTLLRAIYEPLLRIRYREVVLSEADWSEFFHRLDHAEFDPTTLEIDIKTDNGSGCQANFLLRFYRGIIELMVKRYGYPRMISH